MNTSRPQSAHTEQKTLAIVIVIFLLTTEQSGSKISSWVDSIATVISKTYSDGENSQTDEERYKLLANLD